MIERASARIGLRLVPGMAVLLWASAACLYGAAAPAPDCSSCHDQGPKLAKSTHASLSCSDCHEGYKAATHPVGITKPACQSCHAEQAGDYLRGVHGQARKNGNEGAPDCGVCHGSAHETQPPKSQTFRMAVPETCGMCHADESGQFKASVHGQALARGVTQAPICTDCHGEHKIIKPSNAASPVNSSNIRETCGSCHGDVRLTRKFGMPADRLISFDSSFHGLAAQSGSQTVANCASCHGVHNILPSSDPTSTVNAKNLPETCGKCHPGAGQRFAIGKVHITEGASEPGELRWVRQFYLLVIPVTIGLMLLHQGGDFLRKLIRLRFQGRRIGGRGAHIEMRMLPFERIQHGVMAISFIALVWTGFALKYPGHWWARPLLMFESSISMRGWLHRGAAVVFMIISVTHLISLIVSRNLREHWKEMLPRVSDVREALSNFAYNLGLGGRRPYRSPHSYVEKAEYWAVVWGAIVMIASGLILWANNLAMRFLPKSWLDIATSIHFYEAVLASLAIVVWHFYSVIFDPDVYPLNTAFLKGYTVKNGEEAASGRPHETTTAGD